MITLLLEIFGIFILPVLLWQFKIIPIKYRFHTFGFVNIAAVLIIFKEHWTWQQLGIRTDNLNSAFLPYLLFTVIASIMLHALAKKLGRKIVDEWNTNSHFFFGFIILSVLQEFLYRGFLIPKLSAHFNILMVIIINTLLFSLVHIIYPRLKIDMPLIFLGGLIFASIYIYYPNLILICVSHMVLNYIATMYGFFSFYPVKKTV